MLLIAIKIPIYISLTPINGKNSDTHKFDWLLTIFHKFINMKIMKHMLIQILTVGESC